MGRGVQVSFSTVTGRLEVCDDFLIVAGVIESRLLVLHYVFEFQNICSRGNHFPNCSGVFTRARFVLCTARSVTNFVGGCSQRELECRCQLDSSSGSRVGSKRFHRFRGDLYRDLQLADGRREHRFAHARFGDEHSHAHHHSSGFQCDGNDDACG